VPAFLFVLEANFLVREAAVERERDAAVVRLVLRRDVKENGLLARDAEVFLAFDLDVVDLRAVDLLVNVAILPPNRLYFTFHPPHNFYRIYL
jgi:hypothetical protein